MAILEGIVPHLPIWTYQRSLKSEILVVGSSRLPSPMALCLLLSHGTGFMENEVCVYFKSLNNMQLHSQPSLSQ